MRNTEVDRIPVVVGLIFDVQWRVLIGRRTVRDEYFGKWEFPGGKVESGETESAALVRELHEELGIQVVSSTPFDSFPYDYPERRVMLYFRMVRYEGRPQGLEQQQLRWIEVERLNEMDMLAPNVRVIGRLEQFFEDDAR